jgi:hypothetical protein
MTAKALPNVFAVHRLDGVSDLSRSSCYVSNECLITGPPRRLSARGKMRHVDGGAAFNVHSALLLMSRMEPGKWR